MDADQLVGKLAYRGELPVEAILEARTHRAELTPVFVETIEKFVSGADRSTLKSIWMIFHLLGEWREKSAYRALTGLLRRPADDIDQIFAGTETHTAHRVIAAVFDGDPAPLYEVIRDPKAAEFVRLRMFDAVAMLTLREELPRDEAGRFLRACYSEIAPRGESPVWDGWQNAIAVLGLAEFRPLVKRAFERGFISSEWSDLEEFEEALGQAIDDPAAPLNEAQGDYDPFDDAIEELSIWDGVDGAEILEGDDLEWDDGDEDWSEEDGPAITTLPERSSGEPVVNPYRRVGRNDPCPCGSGKKFKKCCLTAAA